MSVNIEDLPCIKRMHGAHGPVDEPTHNADAAPLERSPAEAQEPIPRARPADSAPDESKAIRYPVLDDSLDRALFGEALHVRLTSRRPVKLDPMINDRRRFRAQRNRMKSGFHYAFIPEVQTWYPEESDRLRASLATRSDI